MSLNINRGKFGLCSSALAVRHASWAVQCLSDALWCEITGSADVVYATDSANYYARRTWLQRVDDLDRPPQCMSSCECVELVLS